MIIIFLFWFLALLSCGYAAVVGGKDGKWGAMIILLSAVATVPATQLARWTGTQFPVMTVDVLTLAALYMLALRSVTFWPIWITGFHLVAVATHLATLLPPDFSPRIYRSMASLWAVPGLLSMVVGVALDRNAKRPIR